MYQSWVGWLPARSQPTFSLRLREAFLGRSFRPCRYLVLIWPSILGEILCLRPGMGYTLPSSWLRNDDKPWDLGATMLLCLNEPTCKILSHHWQGFAMHLASDMDLRCFLTHLSPSPPQTHSCAAPEMCIPNSHKKWGFHASDEASRGRSSFILQFGNFVGPKWRTSDLTHPCRFRLVLRVLGQVEHLLDDEDNFGGVLGEQMNPFPRILGPPEWMNPALNQGFCRGMSYYHLTDGITWWQLRRDNRAHQAR